EPAKHLRGVETARRVVRSGCASGLRAASRESVWQSAWWDVRKGYSRRHPQRLEVWIGRARDRRSNRVAELSPRRRAREHGAHRARRVRRDLSLRKFGILHVARACPRGRAPHWRRPAHRASTPRGFQAEGRPPAILRALERETCRAWNRDATVG